MNKLASNLHIRLAEIIEKRKREKDKGNRKKENGKWEREMEKGKGKAKNQKRLIEKH